MDARLTAEGLQHERRDEERCAAEQRQPRAVLRLFLPLRSVRRQREPGDCRQAERADEGGEPDDEGGQAIHYDDVVPICRSSDTKSKSSDK